MTAASGMGALAHAIEAYVLNHAHPLTDYATLAVITTITRALLQAVTNGHHLMTREQMAHGQFLAGMAFNSAGLGLVHSLAHQPSATHNLPHGVCSAFDAVGGDAGHGLISTPSDGGQYINYGTLSLAFYDRLFFTFMKNQKIKFSTFFLRNWEKTYGKRVRRQQFNLMLTHFITHQIKLDIECYIPLIKFKAAIDMLEKNTITLHGKVILTL